MTNVYYDTEFIDNGVTIDLVSIGMVSLLPRPDELYCIVADDRVIDRVTRHPWLATNVLPHLPVKYTLNQDGVTYTRDGSAYQTIKYWSWDEQHPDFKHVMPRSMIRDKVRAFVLSRADPQLWAWYGAYDHVALAQLFGSMVDLPNGIPMWTNDLKQECVRLGNPRMPAQPENAHNALADAAWLAAAHMALTA